MMPYGTFCLCSVKCLVCKVLYVNVECLLQANRPEGCCCVKASSHPDERDDILFYVFKKFYSPFLLSKPVRIIVVSSRSAVQKLLSEVPLI